MVKRYKLSKRQIRFITYYLDNEDRITYSNAYRSALKAGYSDSYAKKITSYIDWEELEERVKKLTKKDNRERYLESENL